MAAITVNTDYTASALLQDVLKVKTNPSAIQQVILEHLKNVSSGAVNIVDPTNPFVFLLEASCINTSAFINEHMVLNRRQYAAAAQTPEDVYLHMSDKDFIDRFATPATTQYSFMFLKSDLINNMIYESSTNSRKITIPRNTEFVVNEVTFSLQYPIDIRELSHGALLIAYDTDVTTPLQNLTTNIIEFETRTDSSGIEWIYFEVDVAQFKIKSYLNPITPAITYSQDLDLTDSFYYARVYYQDSTNVGVWKEIYTTHTDQVYDIKKPTAVLKVVDKTLNVMIPQIYVTNDLVKGTMRVDVYETKGEINIIMENFAISAFTTVLRSIDTDRDSNVYTNATANSTFIAYTAKVVSGGTAALTFEKLRDRVIRNSIGEHVLPITNVQIQSSLEKKGYDIVKNVDLVTNRIFLATKTLPTPFDEKLITAGAASVETLIISMRQAIENTGVKNNGSRITLTPDLIYKNKAGVISIVPKTQVDYLINQTPDVISAAVTGANYLFTPFYYVMDNTSEEFELRPYHLDKPEAISLRFNSQNETTNLQINTATYSITNNDTSYILTIVTKSNQAFQDINDSNVFVQLSYIPINEVARAYINGTLVGRTDSNERIYQFTLGTNYDIDNKDNLIFDTFKMFTNTTVSTSSPLLNNFDILYSTNSGYASTWAPDTTDSLLGRFLLPSDIVGVTHENIKLRFGYSLKTLWARSRSVVASAAFVTHQVDVPWLYEKDVYAMDPITGSNFSFDVNGDISYTILHTAGTPVLDSNGDPVMKYRVGDIVTDASGNPVVIDTNSIVRQIDLMFIEGAYFFATDNAAIRYREEMVNTVVSWLTVDLDLMSQNLLEQTRIYFYPKKSMGTINCMIEDGKTVFIEAGQYFNVQLYVKDNVYKNSELRFALTKATIKIIDTALKSNTISVSQITSLLRNSYGNDVVSVKLTGLGGASNLETLTILNDSDRCSIRKRLVKLPDNKLIVEEDVTCEFIRYQI